MLELLLTQINLGVNHHTKWVNVGNNVPVRLDHHNDAFTLRMRGICDQCVPGVAVKAGLWTLDWTVDWTMDWTVDWNMD